MPTPDNNLPADNPPTDNLDAIITDIWARLEYGARQRKAAMHDMVVATIMPDGTPSQRVMILREADTASAMLRFNSDLRASKVNDLQASPPVSVLGYDKLEKLQFRLSGTARVEHDGPAANAAWDAATDFAKRCYLAEPAPGSITILPISGLDPAIEGRVPLPQEVAPARANFAVLLVDVTRIEWLYLDNNGHRRALFERQADGGWHGQWMVP